MALPWTAAGVGEAADAGAARATAVVGAEGCVAAALGLAAVAAPEVEVPAGGVELWRTRDRKE